MKYQVGVTATGFGYLKLEAPDAKSARKMVEKMHPRIVFEGDIDTALFDSGADLHVDSVVEVEEAPKAGGAA